MKSTGPVIAEGSDAPIPDSGEVMESYTALQMHCPDCDGLMVGARIWDATKQEAYVGLVCRPCDKAYEVTPVAYAYRPGS